VKFGPKISNAENVVTNFMTEAGFMATVARWLRRVAVSLVRGRTSKLAASRGTPARAKACATVGGSGRGVSVAATAS
jgi:hypothetical protein